VNRFKRVIVAGTLYGIRQSFPLFPKDTVIAIMGPSNRPEQLNDIRDFAIQNNVKFLIQSPKRSVQFKDFFQELKNLEPDLVWSNSYSMIIPGEIIEFVNGNAINIHWSLLPRNRGPNPVQWSIIRGEEKTGVTFHIMNNELDGGDILFQEEIPIEKTDTWVTLWAKLEDLAIKMHRRYLDKILNKEYAPVRQNSDLATVNTRLNPESPLIEFAKHDNVFIYNLIRAQVHPLKGAYIKRNGHDLHFDKYMTFEEVCQLRNEYAS
jgi:UDP-4-amino-4-deoxy-L-arabinose formyltransferase/UDP-glucuronic acid dehydrogenase (UDP-4-keto-hexauronic acid decarboxylating)